MIGLEKEYVLNDSLGDSPGPAGDRRVDHAERRAVVQKSIWGEAAIAAARRGT